MEFVGSSCVTNLHWHHHEEATLNTPDEALIIYVNYVTVWLAHIVSNFNYSIDGLALQRLRLRVCKFG